MFLLLIFFNQDDNNHHLICIIINISVDQAYSRSLLQLDIGILVIFDMNLGLLQLDIDL